MMIRKPASVIVAYLCAVLLGSVDPINATSDPVVGRLQLEDNLTKQAPSCLLSGASEVCQSASLVKNTETLFVHVCPSDGKY